MSRDDLNLPSAVIEVVLPIPISHAWVSFACKMAGLTRPRWDVARRVWTTTAPGTITISAPGGRRSLRIEGERADEEVMRRLVSALLTTMRERARMAMR